MGINATTWINVSYLLRAEITVPLPVNIIAEFQHRFKQITMFTLKLSWEISSTMRTEHMLGH